MGGLVEIERQPKASVGDLASKRGMVLDQAKRNRCWYEEIGHLSS